MALESTLALGHGKVSLDREARERLQSLARKSDASVLSRVEGPGDRVETSGSLASLSSARGNALMALDPEWQPILNGLLADPLAGWQRLEDKIRASVPEANAEGEGPASASGRWTRAANHITRLTDAFDILGKALGIERKRAGEAAASAMPGAAALAERVQSQGAEVMEFLRQRAGDLQQSGAALFAGLKPEGAEPPAAEDEDALDEAAQARKSLSREGASLTSRRQQQTLQSLL